MLECVCYTKITLHNFGVTVYVTTVLTEAEIRFAILKLPRNKFPGPDGLSSEFYIQFIDVLVPILKYLYDSLFSCNLNTDNFTIAIYRVILKKDEHSNLKNWRLVSLLNVDYKILTRTLAFRLQKAICKESIIVVFFNFYIF